MLEQAPQYIQYIIRANWPQSEWENAAAISNCESGWNQFAWKNDDIEDSRGLYQINVRAHPNALSLDLFDPVVNARYAASLWRSQGWQPWSCAQILGITDGGDGGNGQAKDNKGLLALAVVGLILFYLWG